MIFDYYSILNHRNICRTCSLNCYTILLPTHPTRLRQLGCWQPLTWMRILYLSRGRHLVDSLRVTIHNNVQLQVCWGIPFIHIFELQWSYSRRCVVVFCEHNSVSKIHEHIKKCFPIQNNKHKQIKARIYLLNSFLSNIVSFQYPQHP